MSADKPPIILIVGPTAVGKTQMAIELAEEFPCIDVISADSRQIFKLMNIGTAKPSPEELSLVPHHFIDIKAPDETFNAGDFGILGREVYEKFRSRGKCPVVVGGSGLYIRSLVDGLFQGEVSDPETKRRLQERADMEGVLKLYDELKAKDPVTAAALHPNDRQRIVRALEVFEITGKSISELRQKLRPDIKLEPVFVGLTRDREKLYRIINERVDKMISAGLIDEVRDLRARGFQEHLQSQKTVGYQEIHQYLDGIITQEEAVELIKRNTRRFAKRQLTWFNRDKRIHWFSIDTKTEWLAARAFLTEKMNALVSSLREDNN